ncbi:MAG: hypothetical protein K8I00_04635 [Candidatus Omnitrophica bacterium]|nr:hypothetical protein [Candidatus Omnitrophota bacterium]
MEPDHSIPPEESSVIQDVADSSPTVTLEITGTQVAELVDEPPVAGPEPEVAAEPIGVVFAKTQFEGVLKTSYVRLSIVNLQDPKKFFELQIGEKIAQQPFSFNVKTVNPGYFFIELPIGSYKFSTVSIPVGGSTASEPLDVTFQVLPDRINYLGTLRLIGTKERIKLGGVPVIRPGFEYEAQVLDQFQEGVATFKQRYPNVPGVLTSQLMRINR